MNKENLSAVILAALRTSGINARPYCISNHAYDAIYLPDHSTIIPVDLKDNKERRSPDNPVLQNNWAGKDNLNVFRIRDLTECTPDILDSFDYYLDNFDNETILALLNYIIAEFGGSEPISGIPDECQAVEDYRRAVEEYDMYFSVLCKAYADAKNVSHIRIGRMQDGEHIGVWLDFKGTDYAIGHGDKVIRSFKASFGSAMDEAHTKGQLSANAANDEQWMQQYNALKQFCEENGGITAVRRKDGMYGSWLTRQRYARRKGKLPAEREALLDALGINWDPNDNRDQVWDEKYDMLLDYQRENGTLDVPQKEGPLGKWVAKQRQQYKKGTLLPERIDRLNSIGFVWISSNSTNVKRT